MDILDGLLAYSADDRLGTHEVLGSSVVQMKAAELGINLGMARMSVSLESDHLPMTAMEPQEGVGVFVVEPGFQQDVELCNNAALPKGPPKIMARCDKPQSSAQRKSLALPRLSLPLSVTLWPSSRHSLYLEPCPPRPSPLCPSLLRLCLPSPLSISCILWSPCTAAIALVLLSLSPPSPEIARGPRLGLTLLLPSQGSPQARRRSNHGSVEGGSQ